MGRGSVRPCKTWTFSGSGGLPSRLRGLGARRRLVAPDGRSPGPPWSIPPSGRKKGLCSIALETMPSVRPRLRAVPATIRPGPREPARGAGPFAIIPPFRRTRTYAGEEFKASHHERTRKQHGFAHTRSHPRPHARPGGEPHCAGPLKGKTYKGSIVHDGPGKRTPQGQGGQPLDQPEGVLQRQEGQRQHLLRAPALLLLHPGAGPRRGNEPGDDLLQRLLQGDDPGTLHRNRWARRPSPRSSRATSTAARSAARSAPKPPSAAAPPASRPTSEAGVPCPARGARCAPRRARRGCARGSAWGA